jgi:hypothetical protein
VTYLWSRTVGDARSYWLEYEHMGFTEMFRGTDCVLFAQDIVFMEKSMVMQLPVT